MNRLIFFLTSFVALCALMGCTASAQNEAALVPLESAKSARILTLGDSITRGSSDGYGNYRRPLQALLTGAGFPYQFVGSNVEQSDNYRGADAEQLFSPYQKGHEGYGGFRIEQIASDTPGTDDGGVTYPGLSRALGQSAPDIVLVMLGTNDVTQNYDDGGADYAGQGGFAGHAASRLNALVSRIFAIRPGVTIVLATITPLRNAELQSRATAYNALIKQMVKTRAQAGEKIVLADMEASLRAGDLAGDGVHPTTLGSNKMARVWFAALTGKAAPALTVPLTVQGQQGQLAQSNLFQPGLTIVASGAFDHPALVAAHLIDGTNKAFVWGKSDDEKVGISGFKGTIERLRFFNTPSYAGRTPRRVTIYASPALQNSLDPAQYVEVGTFELPGAGDDFSDLTAPPVPPDQSEPAARPDAVISHCDVENLKIPAGSRSLLLDFSKADGESDGLSEIQAFTAGQK